MTLMEEAEDRLGIYFVLKDEQPDSDSTKFYSEMFDHYLNLHFLSLEKEATERND